MAPLHPKHGYIRLASVEDAEHVAAHLRSEDRDEVLALCGMDPRLVLPAYVQEGREVHACGFIGKSPEILWGLDPIFGMEDTAAVIWMLSTPAIFEHPQHFVPYSKNVWEAAHQRFQLLTNFTDARNTRHHKWLKWLGAHFIRRVEHFGAQSRPFLEFASYRCA
jgi:hypothetical protein